MFQRTISPPSPRSKSRLSKKAGSRQNQAYSGFRALACCLLLAGFLLGLLFDPEDVLVDF
jgi:hypothetical protein